MQSEDLRDPAYLKIRDMIYQVSGIYQPDEKLYLLASRCARRMSAVKVKTPSEYLEHLTVRGNREAELRLLLNEITIGETYRFRSPPQLAFAPNGKFVYVAEDVASVREHLREGSQRSRV